jgi:DNA polymerase/3'-5' exonuclease PolX
VALDLFLATPAELPFALFHLTSPRAYVIRIRAFAKKVRGWKLTQYGLFYADSGRRVRGSSRIRTQEQLAAFLGVTWRPPAARG